MTEREKHTPGRWEVEYRTGMARAHYGHSVYSTLHNKPGLTAGCCSIAEVRGHDDVEAVANARLIAAAPDLLDLAHAVVTAFGNLVLPTHTEKHLLDGARAAISKAEGGAA